MYVKSIRQTRDQINISGYAQANSRVSTLMRNLEASPLLERPDLVEIKAETVSKRRLNEFNLNVFITRQTTEDAKKGKGAGAAAKDTKP